MNVNDLKSLTTHSSTNKLTCPSPSYCKGLLIPPCVNPLEKLIESLACTVSEYTQVSLDPSEKQIRNLLQSRSLQTVRELSWLSQQLVPLGQSQQQYTLLENRYRACLGLVYDCSSRSKIHSPWIGYKTLRQKKIVLNICLLDNVAQQYTSSYRQQYHKNKSSFLNYKSFYG